MNTPTTLKTGTKLELFGCGGNGYRSSFCRIVRWTKVNGPRMEGWDVVQYEDGYRGLFHTASTHAYRIIR